MNIQTKQAFGEGLNEQNKELQMEHHWKFYRKDKRLVRSWKTWHPNISVIFKDLVFLASCGLAFCSLETTLSYSCLWGAGACAWLILLTQLEGSKQLQCCSSGLCCGSCFFSLQDLCAAFRYTLVASCWSSRFYTSQVGEIHMDLLPSVEWCD